MTDRARIVLLGATGTIGHSVAAALGRQGVRTGLSPVALTAASGPQGED